jgi:hypothetical protein
LSCSHLPTSGVSSLLAAAHPRPPSMTPPDPWFQLTCVRLRLPPAGAWHSLPYSALPRARDGAVPFIRLAPPAP